MGSGLKRTERKLVRIEKYSGICDGCGSPFVCDRDMVGIEVFKNELLAILFPVDELECLSCNNKIHFIKLWMNLDVTNEIGKVGNHAAG
jgi:hypothetical protein